jgi:WD40 repeat protein
VNAKTKEIVWSCDAEQIAYSISSFSPDDSMLAVASPHEVLIFDVPTGDVIQRLPGMDESVWFKSASFSPDGKWLACGTTSGQVHLFSLPSFRQVHIIETGAAVCDDVQFSPDGRALITANFSNRIKVYSPVTGELLQPEYSPTPSFQIFNRFSRDGKRVVSAGMDGKVRIWDARTGEQLLMLEIPHGTYPIGNFSPDGNSIIVGAGNNAFIFRAPDPDQLKRLSKAELRDIACENHSRP